MTKQQVSNVTSSLHQWMTIVGFPILILLVGDIYTDFKEIRSRVIKHEEQISTLNRAVDNHDEKIETISQYLYRGVKQ